MMPTARVSLAGLLLASTVGLALAAPATGPDAPRQNLSPNARLNGVPGEQAPAQSPRDSRTECDNAIPLTCNTTFNGSSALAQNGDLWQAYCFSGETAPEVIHRLDHPGGVLSLTLNSSDSAQLDLILLGDCDPFNCLAMPWLVGSSESISGTYAPATYYVVVDAYFWNGAPFTYELSTVCTGPVDLCANALPLPCGQVTSGSSADSQNGNVWNSYCFSGESAPEVIYELNHPGGPLNLHLTSSNSSQLDLVLLGSCDANDCLSMPWFVGSDETISGSYDAGTYYVVVDAYNWNGLPFDFEIEVTCPGQQDFCANALPLGCNETVVGNSALSQNGNLWGVYCYGGESAPEVVYELNHPGGLLDLRLSSGDSYLLDLILLGSCDPADCVAMPWLVGSTEQISGEFPAGTYYVVVDAFGWDGLPFSYTLQSGACITDADCHHTSSFLVVALPDESAQAYFQRFVPTEAALLETVVMQIDGLYYPDHDGTLTLSVRHLDGNFDPTVVVGSLDFEMDGLAAGYHSFDLSGLGYVTTPDQDFFIGLEFSGDAPADRIGFLAGLSGAGYEGYSSFFDGSSYDGWWTNGFDWYDELNVCITTGPAPCLPQPLVTFPVAGQSMLVWSVTSGQLRIESAPDGYGPFTTLAIVDAADGTYTDLDALAAGRRFYRAVRICN